MSQRIIYISKNCPYCKKLLIGIHKYEFLRSQFIIVDVGTNQYPDYIKSVPTLVMDQNMIKGDDVFGYMNHMVEQIFKSNPQLKEKYHPSESKPATTQNNEETMPAKPVKGPAYDPVDDLVGWCPDGGCSFSIISETNDDCSKKMVSLDDNMFAVISDSNDKLVGEEPQKVDIGNDNTNFQKSAKQKQMDESYERLMAERNLIK